MSREAKRSDAVMFYEWVTIGVDFVSFSASENGSSSSVGEYY